MFILESFSVFRNDYPSDKVMLSLMKQLDNKKSSLTCPATGKTAYFSTINTDFHSVQTNFKYLEFYNTDVESALDDALPEREKELLCSIIHIIDKHVSGLYEIHKANHESRKGLMEVDPLLNSKQRRYFTCNNGLIDKMKEVLVSCSNQDIDFMFHNLMGVEKGIIYDDTSLKFINYFLQYKQGADEHKLPDENYRKNVMTSKGIRPDTRRHRIATTKQLMYHGIFGMLIDTLKEYSAKERKYPKYIELYNRTQKIFDKEKLHRQELVYDIAIGSKAIISHIDMPERNIHSPLDNPTLFSDKVKKISVLIDIIIEGNQLEADADVNINSKNKKHLLYFMDYENQPKYAVSHDSVPMCGKDRNAKIFSTLEDAYAYWNK